MSRTHAPSDDLLSHSPSISSAYGSLLLAQIGDLATCVPSSSVPKAEFSHATHLLPRSEYRIRPPCHIVRYWMAALFSWCACAAKYVVHVNGPPTPSTCRIPSSSTHLATALGLECAGVWPETLFVASSVHVPDVPEVPSVSVSDQHFRPASPFHDSVSPSVSAQHLLVHAATALLVCFSRNTIPNGPKAACNFSRKASDKLPRVALGS